jgi:hypothetical protein
MDTFKQALFLSLLFFFARRKLIRGVTTVEDSNLSLTNGVRIRIERFDYKSADVDLKLRKSVELASLYDGIAV